ncbi:MAG: RelA/SpoT domain-containing protein, partial [Planctomycetia bacterium]
MSIDPQWHKEQVEKYSNDELKSYSIYAETLREILTKASSQHAPLAIVQARPKSVSSFAEKAARKASKYADPVHQITDLCGARVITHTQEQVDQVCEFIKTNFEIDEKNSLDVRTRLGHSEFGYLSVHYIVQITAGEILGIPIPPEIGDRKAEIQVRTVLQHAWADITHDRLYKSGFRVPDRFKRNAAALAATLESSDGQFGRFVNEMDAYVGEYSAYMDREEMDKEIAILEVVLENEPKEANKPAIALRIARIAQSSGDYSTVFEKLEPIAESDSLCTDEILNELGTALVYLAEQERDPEKAAQKAARGQELLRRAGRVDDPLPSQTTGPLEKNECITRASALSTLACSYGKTSGNEYQARDCYRKALTLVPQDPYHLTSLLEYEIFCTRDTDFAAAMRPVLSGAVATCREHIRVGIELPRAYFTIGKLNLLMNQPMEALAAYAKAISFCNSDNACVPDNIYATQEAFLQRINPGRQLPEEHDWIRQ